MNPTRYILTRTCLQEGSLRLLKFNEFYFPQSGPALFVDERGKEYGAEIDREAMKVTGLSDLYHDHNLAVNDVLTITPLAPSRYEVMTTVKPYSTPRARQNSRRDSRDSRDERRRDGERPSVREVRPSPNNLTGRQKRTGPSGGGGRNLSGLGEERRTGDQPATALKPIAPAFTPQAPQSGRGELSLQSPLFPPARPTPRETPPTGSGAAPAKSETASGEISPTPAPSASPIAPLDSAALQDQVAEFARLTGYRLSPLGHGLLRLSADLGEGYRYSVLLATEPMATTYPEWESADDYHALITHESDKGVGVPRLTREALAALTEHARLAHLGALDLRGYWRSGDINLDSAASVAELVSQHLAQRGALTYVLMTLSGYSAQSVISVTDLAQRLGSAVSLDNLREILETLSRPPFLALSPLPDDHLLLRTSVPDLLGDLSDYAQGVRRRLRTGQTSGAGNSNSPHPAPAGGMELLGD